MLLGRCACAVVQILRQIGQGRICHSLNDQRWRRRSQVSPECESRKCNHYADDQGFRPDRFTQTTGAGIAHAAMQPGAPTFSCQARAAFTTEVRTMHYGRLSDLSGAIIVLLALAAIVWRPEISVLAGCKLRRPEGIRARPRQHLIGERGWQESVAGYHSLTFGPQAAVGEDFVCGDDRVC